MENAAVAARDVIVERWGIRDRDILVVCGSGNNGGDGFALARLLYARGAAVTVLVAGDPEEMKGAGADNYRILRQLPLEIIILESSPHPPVLDRLDLNDYHLIVDALLGTGISRNLEGRMALLISRINAADVPVLSLDIPTGVSADTGQVMGTAVNAEATVTFGLPKRGNLLYPGFALGGQLYCSEISFPPEVTGDEEVVLSVNIPPLMPPRDPAGHKGSFGKVLIIGGSPSYRGAPALAAGAALKSGAGYVTLAVPGSLVPQIFPLVPEAVFLPLGGAGPMGAGHLPELLEQAMAADAAVIGPGLSSEPESLQLAREFIISAEAPLVIDGDALTALAGREELCREREYPTCLTPHPGEMARLLGSSVKEVEARRIETALEAAERYGASVVLKGAHSIIAGPDGSAWINLTGNSGMGTAGSGDVLAGLAGSLFCRFPAGTSATEVLKLAVHLHGLAGDLAAAELGEDGMTASDILRRLPAALAVYGEKILADPFSGRITPI
jgi:NAD(P)H-hydrate epimerase